MRTCTFPTVFIIRLDTLPPFPPLYLLLPQVKILIQLLAVEINRLTIIQNVQMAPMLMEAANLDLEVMTAVSVLLTTTRTQTAHAHHVSYNYT